MMDKIEEIIDWIAVNLFDICLIFVGAVSLIILSGLSGEQAIHFAFIVYVVKEFNSIHRKIDKE